MEKITKGLCLDYLLFVQLDRTCGYGPQNPGSNPGRKAKAPGGQGAKSIVPEARRRFPNPTHFILW